jgi:hypothetical protein
MLFHGGMLRVMFLLLSLVVAPAVAQSQAIAIPAHPGGQAVQWASRAECRALAASRARATWCDCADAWLRRHEYARRPTLPA